jgi:hypothetical protein
LKKVRVVAFLPGRRGPERRGKQEPLTPRPGRLPVPSLPRLDRASLAVVTLFMAAGLVFRFAGLSQQSLWYDELYTFHNTDPRLGLVEVFRERMLPDPSPPLYFLTLHFWQWLVSSSSEFALRLPSAIFGALAMVMAVVYGRRVLSPPGLAFFLVFFSCSLGAINYAQEARAYSLLLLFATIITLLAFDLGRRVSAGEAPHVGDYARLATWAVLAGLTHFFGVLLANALFALLLAQGLVARRGVARALAAWLCVAAITIGWFAYHLRWSSPTLEDWWISRSPREMLVQVVKVARDLAFGSEWVGLAIVGGLVALTARPYARRIRAIAPPTRLVFELPFAGAAVCALVLAFAVALSLRTPIVLQRYFIVILPALYLSLASLYEFADGSWRFSPRQRAGVLLICGLLLTIPMWSYYAPHKDQWREAAAYIRGQKACAGATIPVLSLPEEAPGRGWLHLYQYYLPGAAGVTIVPFDPAHPPARAGACPVRLWAARPRAQAFQKALAALGPDPGAFDIVPFLENRVVVERSGATAANPPR